MNPKKRTYNPSPISKTENRTTEPFCQRCGACCQKGGPVLHLSDKPLLAEGKITSTRIFTIRKYEPVYNNILQKVEPAGQEMIKIKGKDGSWECIFFDANGAACAIYENRPLQCRALKCWDTRDLEAIYEKNRLGRKDVIGKNESLLQLVQSHDKQCDYRLIHNLASCLAGEDPQSARNRLYELYQFDKKIRELTVQKAGIDLRFTDFLFGRPLGQTLKGFGIKIVETGDSFRIITDNR